MKIGILTQPIHYNYGGILQNWALQQILLKLGHQPEMIFLAGQKRPHGKLLAMRCLSFMKCVIKRYIFSCKNVYIYPILNPRYTPAVPRYVDDTFVKRICKTKPLTADMNLTRYVQKRKYDAFIVGSDQVWREEYSPDILSYFLDFLPHNDKRKRIAYAASFGKAKNYISCEKMAECSRLLQRFDAVSVREDEGISIVRNDFARRKVEKVLDPTMLLSVRDYENIIDRRDRHTSPYIMSYILDSSEEKRSILNEISSDKTLAVEEICMANITATMPTVSQWLANFADADFVVTDSFHGCVFSIIFGKPLVAIANAERGLDRFVSLMGEFGLSDHLIVSFDDFMARKSQLMSSPDYTQVYNRLDILRQSSLKFLTNALA